MNLLNSYSFIKYVWSVEDNEVRFENSNVNNKI